jgi:hypothetical protein
MRGGKSQRLAEENRRLAQENRRLAQENRRLARENQRLCEENRGLSQENRRLVVKNQRLGTKQALADQVQRLLEDDSLLATHGEYCDAVNALQTVFEETQIFPSFCDGTGPLRMRTVMEGRRSMMCCYRVGSQDLFSRLYENGGEAAKCQLRALVNAVPDSHSCGFLVDIVGFLEEEERSVTVLAELADEKTYNGDILHPNVHGSFIAWVGTGVVEIRVLLRGITHDLYKPVNYCNRDMAAVLQSCDKARFRCILAPMQGLSIEGLADPKYTITFSGEQEEDSEDEDEKPEADWDYLFLLTREGARRLCIWKGGSVKVRNVAFAREGELQSVFNCGWEPVAMEIEAQSDTSVVV